MHTHKDTYTHTRAQGQVAEAQRALEGEVGSVVAEARAAKTQEIDRAARAVEVQHVVRVSGGEARCVARAGLTSVYQVLTLASP